MSPGEACYSWMSCWVSKEPGPGGSGAPLGVTGVARAPVWFGRESPDAARCEAGRPFLLGEATLRAAWKRLGRAGEASCPGAPGTGPRAKRSVSSSPCPSKWETYPQVGVGIGCCFLVESTT